jgi:hypothetical protein
MTFTAFWVPPAVLLPLLAAALLHRYVEAPALRHGRTLARRGTSHGVAMTVAS